jgi:hypothetical protein
MTTINTVKKLADQAGKTLKYNRSTGMYEIRYGFTSSEGEHPSRNENGKLELSESQLKKLISYI